MRAPLCCLIPQTPCVELASLGRLIQHNIIALLALHCMGFFLAKPEGDLG